MEQLTPKQKHIRDIVTGHIGQTGRTPTIREIAAAAGVAIGTAQDHLHALIRKGYLRHRPGSSRGIMPAHHHPQTAVPVLGRVHAGTLTEALEAVEEYIYLDKRHTAGGEYFALKVRGDSMTGAGILEGDIVVVRRQPVADDGEIVVAAVDGEAAVKRLRRRRGTIVLEAANPRYPALKAPHASVLGKVVFLTRPHV